MGVIKYFVLCEKANALSKVKQNVGMVIKRETMTISPTSRWRLGIINTYYQIIKKSPYYYSNFEIENKIYSDFIHANAFFNSNVDLKDNLTINPKHEYPMDTKHNYIQIIWVKNLYQYNSLYSDSFVAPTNKKHGQDNNKIFRSNGVYYIRLSEYQMKFKPHYNISKTKASICLGYVNK